MAYSKHVARLQGLSARAVFYRQDLWKFDLSKYDNVVLFGVESMVYIFHFYIFYN